MTGRVVIEPTDTVSVRRRMLTVELGGCIYSPDGGSC